MRLRPYVVRTLVRKDIARLLRNGPALMLLGLMVVIAILTASSGLAEEDKGVQASSEDQAWIVYWANTEWVQFLKRRAPKELGIRFVNASQQAPETYPTDRCVIELRPPIFDPTEEVTRRHVSYRYPGSDPGALWPYGSWFLAASVDYFGDEPQFLQTIQPLVPATQSERTRAALERVSIADIMSVSLIGTALLTTIQFFAACGLLVSLTAQERERGAMRALLLTPASYFEFILAKAFVHGSLALGTSALVVGALQPAVLGSLLFWATMIALTSGYFAVGLVIASFARNQAAPNLLSFAYLLMIGALNLLGARFEAFQFLSALTFERYGLMFTLTSLTNADLNVASSLSVIRTPDFRMLVLLVSGLLLIASFVGSRRMRSD